MFGKIKNIVRIRKLKIMKSFMQNINEIVTRNLVIPITSTTAERTIFCNVQYQNVF